LSNGIRAASPGIEICGGASGGTTHDRQFNGAPQRSIAVSGNPAGSITHFVWTYWDVIPDSLEALEFSRFANYNCWSQPFGLGLGQCGISLELDSGDPVKAHSGFPSVSTATGDLGSVALHGRNAANQDPPGPNSAYIFDPAIPCFGIYAQEELELGAFPHMEIDVGGSSTKAPGEDVYHIVHCESGDETAPCGGMTYWRRIGGVGGTWQGPVVLDDEAGGANHHVAVDPTSTRIAVFYERDDLDPNGRRQVGYLESPDNGANWIAAGGYPNPIEPSVGPYVAITSYSSPTGAGPEAWTECTGEYDLEGIKHLVWIEQAIAGSGSDCFIQHWDEIHGTKTVATAVGWTNSGMTGSGDLWLSCPSIAFGDGATACSDGPGDQSNHNYIYVTFEQYGGPSMNEAADKSSANFQNLEIYLAVSNNGGAGFSEPVNLTGTQSPNCDGSTFGQDCASERDPCLAKIVNDTIHLSYILDRDAGDVVMGQGSWTFNPVMYYRIPGGTDAQYLCPELNCNVAARVEPYQQECPFNAQLTVAPQQDTRNLVIENNGLGLCSGTITTASGSDWLVLTQGAFALPPGSPSLIRSVTCDATAPSITGEGVYYDEIRISHNGSQPSPIVIPVEFHVFDGFSCDCPDHADLTADCPVLLGDRCVLSGTPLPPVQLLVKNIGPLNSGPFSVVYSISPLPFLTTGSMDLLGGQPYVATGINAFSSLTLLTEDMSIPDGYPTGPAYLVATIAPNAVIECDETNNTLAIPIIHSDGLPGSCELLTPLSPAAGAGDVPVDAMLWWQNSRLAAMLAAEFNNKTVDAPIGTGGASAGEPVQVDGTISATVRSTPFATRSLEIQDNSTCCDGYALFEFVDNLEVTEGTLTIATTLWFDQLNGYNLLVREQGGVTKFFTNLFFFGGGTITQGDAQGLVGNIGTYSTGVPTPIVLRFDLDAGTYDIWINDVPVVIGRGHGITDRGIGSVLLGTRNDADLNGRFHVDDLAVTWDAGYETAYEVTLDQSNPPLSVICSDLAGTLCVPGPLNCGTTYYWQVVETDCSGGIAGPVWSFTTVPCTCLCPHQSDFDEDGSVTAVDLAVLIDIVFFGFEDITDPSCPISRADFDASGTTDAVDLALLIDHVFFGGTGPVDPCL